MPSEFGGGKFFNGPSPSSDTGIVNRIVADYVTPSMSRPRRVLDVGGTAHGFRARAVLPEGTEFVTVNPSGPPDAEYASLDAIPAGDPGFDFAMLFGVLMYGDRASMVGLLQAMRSRLRGEHPTLLVAEPDPVSVAGFADALLKTVLVTPYRILSQMSWSARFHFYSRSDAEAMLFDAGFGIVQQREDLNPRFRKPIYYVLAASY